MEEQPIATMIIEMLKKSIHRLYVLLIITIILFIISIVDSFYQRYRIEDILEQIDFVEETETREITQDGNGTNNYIGEDGDIIYGTKN